MGIANRAFRNISRRKIRASLVIIALAFSMAIMISIPAGASANQQSAQSLTQTLSNTISLTESSINQTATQIDCSLTPSFQNFGFNPQNSTFNQFGPGPRGTFDPSQFGGGGGIPGEFGGGAFAGRGSTPMNESLYSDIESIQNVAATVPILQASEGTNQTISSFGRSFTLLRVEYVIQGIPLNSSLIDSFPILPTNITAGRNLKTEDSGVVVLSENNSAFFGVGVGDNVTILGRVFLVVGIHGTSGVSDRTTLYMSLSDAQTLTNNAGIVTSLEVFAANSDVVSSVADAIGTLHPELTVTTAQDRLTSLQNMQNSYNTALANAQTTLNQTQTTAVEEIVVAIAATSMVVLFVMLYTVRERTKEIGTLKAIGFSNWTIMSQFMLEGVLLSLIAGVFGIAIASVAAPLFSGLLLPAVTVVAQGTPFGRAPGLASAATVTLTPILVLIALGAAVVLGALGSLYPAWRASKTRPAEAMKYE